VDGCVVGALSYDDYISKLTLAGFLEIEVEVTRVYYADEARAFLSAKGYDVDAVADEIDGKFVSAFVRAIKPAP
jgi:hypothetical protein